MSRCTARAVWRGVVARPVWSPPRHHRRHRRRRQYQLHDDWRLRANGVLLCSNVLSISYFFSSFSLSYFISIVRNHVQSHALHLVYTCVSVRALSSHWTIANRRILLSERRHRCLNIDADATRPRKTLSSRAFAWQQHGRVFQRLRQRRVIKCHHVF